MEIVISYMPLHDGQPIMFTTPNCMRGMPTVPFGGGQEGQTKSIQRLKLPPTLTVKVCLHFTHLYIGFGEPSLDIL